jgi:hypothetical protein
MRKILFLDFDGVLHADLENDFSRLPDFEGCLRDMPELEIVISSSWRELHPLETLKTLFRPEVRGRIIAATPVLEGGYEMGGRQREIETFLRSSRLDASNAAWAALDDIPFFFDPGCPFLILVDPARGFGEVERLHLSIWYRLACSR